MKITGVSGFKRKQKHRILNAGYASNWPDILLLLCTYIIIYIYIYTYMYPQCLNNKSIINSIKVSPETFHTPLKWAENPALH